MMAGRMMLTALAGLALLGLGATTAAAEPAAKMGDWTLSSEEVDKELQVQLADLEMKRHQIRVMKIEEKIINRVLELEAKEKKTTPEALMKAAGDKAEKVSDEQVKSLIEANKSRLPPNKDIATVTAEVKSGMEMQNQRKAQGKYLDELMKKYKPEVLLVPPPPPRLTVEGPFVNSKGPEKATVTLVEYSDFQCPFCKQGADVLKSLEKEFPGQLRIVYRHFPLANHPSAAKAAEASQCAADQGKFWEYHDALFANQEKIDPAMLKKTAEELKLKVADFNKCLDEGKKASVVKQDMESARILGVDSTPAFFVNGLPLRGVLPLEPFKKMINDEIELVKNPGKAAAK